MRVLKSLCQGRVTGVDFSTGMLAQARSAHPDARWVRADVRALPFAGAFDLAVSFWALGHSCPPNRPRCSPGSSARCGQPGSSLSPVGAPQRTCPLHAVRDDLTASGFTVTTVPLTALGRREDGSPRYRLVPPRKARPP
jgi:SAM-dependent methyltransferase